MPLSENLTNRKWLLSKMRAEIVGPDPAGESEDIRLTGEAKLYSWDEFRKPRRQLNGEEIIWQDPPAKRYGAGVLYPVNTGAEVEQLREASDEAQPEVTQVEIVGPDERTEKEGEKTISGLQSLADFSEDYDVTLANAFKPSALGLSFLADLSVEQHGIVLELVNLSRSKNDEIQEGASGRYRKIAALVGEAGSVNFPRSLWLRVPLLDAEGHFPNTEFTTAELLAANLPIKRRLDFFGLPLEVVLVVRGAKTYSGSMLRLITVSLVNRGKGDLGNIDEQCLFQAGIRVRGMGKSNWIQPYPEAKSGVRSAEHALSDESINQLLYREYQTFAIGHGCAADWLGDKPNMVSQIWSDVMPAFETPSTSADLFITSEDGTRQAIQVSMRKLAGLDPKDNGIGELEMLIKAYSDWIATLRANPSNVPEVPAGMRDTADGLIDRCEKCLDRIRDGIQFLAEDTEISQSAAEAFRFANYSMLVAQLRSTRNIREPTLTSDRRITWPEAINPNPSIPDPKRGYWRAFQIAFLLMSLRGIAEPENAEREIVDLIWFPTGGGKTEAYLGLTAFAIFFNRLSGRNSGGADVLMRYTLRLLTAQQFQRAALLFCAMEHLRRKEPKLGDKAFRIGLWVGGSASPNTRKDALYALDGLEIDPERENPFVLLKCPWCGAKFGPSSKEGGERQRKGRRGQGGSTREVGIPSVLGYQRFSPTNKGQATVVFRCNDGACEFGTASTFGKARPPLPIVIIDEDLFDDPPNLVIGTVDKFAMLAWKPEARRIFGIGDYGKHIGLPPSLIIQDELHLISGPLGSMVGAYETIIERLCRKNGVGSFKPKIIASTATISRAREQIKHLYARDDIFLFPPSGLVAGDSFFSRDARDEAGDLKPGRLYVGVLATSHGSFQTTQARVYATLMQHAATMVTDDAGRDPWWTLLCFFNSLRELGGAASLFVADARDYLRVILDRQGMKYEVIRKLFEISELTSRIRSDQVPKELERLEKVFTSQVLRANNTASTSDTVDACLASNIIEVGVDVSRLALMAIVGQPKTTSQYIQVSSRVGRDPEKPGMVVILYGPSKPRDRSHFERFRPYHQKLYAQVEPTSVTPFSSPAVDRALHGVVVAAVRQLGTLLTESNSPDPFPLAEGAALRDLVEEMIDERVSLIAPEERDAVMKKLQRRLDEWRVWQPSEYGGFGAASQDPPLIYPAGSTAPPSWNGRGWPTMSSLRDVDASCEAEVTSFFNQLITEQE